MAFFEEGTFPVFCAKDDLIHNLSVGAHNLVFVKPLRGCVIVICIPRISSGAIDIQSLRDLLHEALIFN